MIAVSLIERSAAAFRCATRAALTTEVITSAWIATVQMQTATATTICLIARARSATDQRAVGSERAAPATISGWSAGAVAIGDLIGGADVAGSVNHAPAVASGMIRRADRADALSGQPSVTEEHGEEHDGEGHAQLGAALLVGRRTPGRSWTRGSLHHAARERERRRRG